MPKLLSFVLLSCALLAAAGCEMNRNPVPTADHALNTYHARLAESCPGKHMDQLPQAKLNQLAEATYIGANTQAQQMIDQRVTAECAAHGDHPACYNTGFLEAENMTGALPEFIKKVCGQPAVCPGGNCETARPETASAAR